MVRTQDAICLSRAVCKQVPNWWHRDERPAEPPQGAVSMKEACIQHAIRKYRTGHTRAAPARARLARVHTPRAGVQPSGGVRWLDHLTRIGRKEVATLRAAFVARNIRQNRPQSAGHPAQGMQGMNSISSSKLMQKENAKDEKSVDELLKDTHCLMGQHLWSAWKKYVGLFFFTLYYRECGHCQCQEISLQ